MLRPFFFSFYRLHKEVNHKSKTLWSRNAHKQVNFLSPALPECMCVLWIFLSPLVLLFDTDHFLCAHYYALVRIRSLICHRSLYWFFYLSKRSNLFSRLQKLYREKHVLHSNLYERLIKSHAVSNILFQKFNGWFYEKDKCLISANWHPFEESFTRYCKSHIDHQSFQITPRIEPSTRITIKLHIQRWEKIDSE